MPEDGVGGIVLQMPAEHADAGNMELLFCQDNPVFGIHITVAEISDFIHDHASLFLVEIQSAQQVNIRAALNKNIQNYTAYIFNCNTISKII